MMLSLPLKPLRPLSWRYVGQSPEVPAKGADRERALPALAANTPVLQKAAYRMRASAKTGILSASEILTFAREEDCITSPSFMGDAPAWDVTRDRAAHHCGMSIVVCGGG